MPSVVAKPRRLYVAVIARSNVASPPSHYGRRPSQPVKIKFGRGGVDCYRGRAWQHRIPLPVKWRGATNEIKRGIRARSSRPTEGKALVFVGGRRSSPFRSCRPSCTSSTIPQQVCGGKGKM
ncbi:uncharacterized protein J3R85_016847 [Psidium guajava]|nr:uncharacterized protein J3R85_016847 [Psidium guajava]